MFDRYTGRCAAVHMYANKYVFASFLVCECAWACDRLRSQWCQQQMRGRRFVAVCHNEVRSDQNISPEAAIYSICLSQTTSAPKL